MASRRGWLWLLVAPFTFSGAQRGTAVKLPGPDRVLSEEFSSIVGTRELKDGRVLIADDRDNRVVVVDFSKGTVLPVGRQGRGPGEYERIKSLIPMPGDSTLMTQDDGGTWVVFAGASPPVLQHADESI